MKTVAATLALACAMNAQSANPLSAEASQVYASVKNNILRSAEKMPEENKVSSRLPGCAPLGRFSATWRRNNIFSVAP
jgi:hypothetical protein